MSPLPGWKVIPDGWAEHHRPTVDTTRVTPATFRRVADGPAPYPLPEGYDPAGRVIWETEVRAQALNRRGGEVVSADQPNTLNDYLLVAPVGGPPLRAGERGDVVELLGRKMRVKSVATGSHLWELDIIVEDNLTQQNPT